MQGCIWDFMDREYYGDNHNMELWISKFYVMGIFTDYGYGRIMLW